MRGARYASMVVAIALLAGCGDAKTTVKTVTVDRPASMAEDLDNLDLGRAPVSIFRRCDANISARKRTTTCAFASNVFYEYWGSGSPSTIRAYSPTAGRYFRLRCSGGGATIVCRTNRRGAVKFPTVAVERYSAAQAERYARNHYVGPGSDAPLEPPAPPRPPPEQPPAPASAVDFCATHNCIPNFDNGNGSVVQCSDGMWSQSGGIQGACSGHGGLRR
jgi:hypothetical protein